MKYSWAGSTAQPKICCDNLCNCVVHAVDLDVEVWRVGVVSVVLGRSKRAASCVIQWVMHPVTFNGLQILQEGKLPTTKTDMSKKDCNKQI